MKAIVWALVLASSSVSGSAQDKTGTTAPGPTPELSYWSVWADKDGATHITRCSMTSFMLQAFAPPARPEWTRPLPDEVAAITFAVQPVGWIGEWHKNPKPQWVIPISGRWYVELTDGKKATMGPGEASFGGDQGAHTVGGSGKSGIGLVPWEIDRRC